MPNNNILFNIAPHRKLAELRQDKSNLKKLLFTSKNEKFPDLAAQRSELLTNGIKIADIKVHILSTE